MLPGSAMALNGADVMLYSDPSRMTPIPTNGAWQDGITAVTNMLKAVGLTYELVDFDNLNSSTQEFVGLYKAIFFAGGYAAYYNDAINLTGKTRIRDFVANGGGYYGICAGAFFACDRIEWEGVTYDDLGGAGYTLDLFQGQGFGPITAIADWDNPTNHYNMTPIAFTNQNSVLTNFHPSGSSEAILYYGGPWFQADTGQLYEVLGTYDYSGSYNGKPAIIAFTYGKGRVVLSGPHPEIHEDSDADGVTIEREGEMNDEGGDWELVLHIFNWLTARENLVLPEKGGHLDSFTSQLDSDLTASNLTDGAYSGVTPWCSAADPGPQDFVYSFRSGQVARLSHVAMGNFAYFFQSCKDFSISVSTNGGVYTPVTNATLALNNSPAQGYAQVYDLRDVLADSIKVTITNGYYAGSPDYWEMSEIGVFGVLFDSGAPDRDGDGLPDTWEVRMFGRTWAHTGTDDPDQDGHNNLMEYQRGTNPTRREGSPAVFNLLLN